jgi:hypothetical protein
LQKSRYGAVIFRSTAAERLLSLRMRRFLK